MAIAHVKVSLIDMEGKMDKSFLPVGADDKDGGDEDGDGDKGGHREA